MPNPNLLRYLPGPSYKPEVRKDVPLNPSTTFVFDTQQIQKGGNGGNSQGKMSLRYVAVPIQLDRPRTKAVSPLNDRPHAIEELARIAEAGKPPDSKFLVSLDAAVVYLEIFLHQAIEDHTIGDLQMAFVNYARAASLTTKRLLEHPLFHTSKIDLARSCSKRTAACLNELERIKPILIQQYQYWVSQHPGVPLRLDLPYILNTILARDEEEIQIRRQIYDRRKRDDYLEEEDEDPPPPIALAPSHSYGPDSSQLVKLTRKPSQNSTNPMLSRSNSSTALYFQQAPVASQKYPTADVSWKYDSGYQHEEPRLYEKEQISYRKSDVDLDKRREADLARQREAQETSVRAYEANRKEAEARQRHWEDQQRAQEEAQIREAERKRLETEARRREWEEQRRLLDEKRRREEEVRRREEVESKRKAVEERKRQEETEEAKRQEAAERKLREEERKRKMWEADDSKRRSQEEAKWQEEERRREDAAWKRQEERRRTVPVEPPRRATYDTKQEERGRTVADEPKRRATYATNGKQDHEKYSQYSQEGDLDARSTRQSLKAPVPSPLTVTATSSTRSSYKHSSPPSLSSESPPRIEYSVVPYEKSPPKGGHGTTPERAQGRGLLSPPITTTTPAPRDKLSSIQMTLEQRRQGYGPSLQSPMAKTFDKPPPINKGLLFQPHSGPNERNIPRSPDRAPAHVRHLMDIQRGIVRPQRPPSPNSRILIPDQVKSDEQLTVFPEKIFLKVVHVPDDLISRFLSIASINTEKNKETCGLLMGKEEKEQFKVTDLVIPKQRSTSESCVMEPEEIVAYQEAKSLVTLGWIHTHPTTSCFMTSLDLHTQANFQRDLAEFFAIVCSPRFFPETGVFRLTDPPGLKRIIDCQNETPHHSHTDKLPLYTDADKGHVMFVEEALPVIADLR